MKQTFHLLFFLIGIGPINGQIQFTNHSHLLANKEIHTHFAIAVVDMNGDGLDDIVRLDEGQELYIDYQTDPGSPFTGKYINSFSSNDIQWSICVADVNRNGWNDIFTGDSRKLRLLLAIPSEDEYQPSPSNATFPVTFLQGSNFIDIDNDGHVDIFACHDEGVSIALRNDSEGSFSLDTTLIYPVSSIPSDNSGNYGSIWTDFDNDGDQDLYLSKCSILAEDPDDPRRLNQLYRNEGNGQWTELAAAIGLQPKGQSWSTAFGDIDNDGDFDAFVINHDINSVLYVNNGEEGFVNINVASGIEPILSELRFGSNCNFADFDNDGYLDLLITGSFGRHVLFHNQGNLQFTDISNKLPSFFSVITPGIGDLNNDGFLDIASSVIYSNNSVNDPSDALLLSDGNSNHYLKVLLNGVLSNPNAIGARLECYDNGRRQIREVRSGEGFGIMNSFTQHFGVGQQEKIDSLLIYWPSGLTDRLYDIDVDQSLRLSEGESCEKPVDILIVENEFKLRFTAQSETQAVAWHWDFGDGSEAVGAMTNHIYESPGSYEVCLTINTACGTQLQTCQNTTISLSAIPTPSEEQPDYLLSPNPSTGFLRLSWTKSTNEPQRLMIYNRQGQQLPTPSYSKAGQVIDLSLSNIPIGSYQLQVLNKAKQWKSIPFILN